MHPPTAKKKPKNREKSETIRKKREKLGKRGKNWEKEEKSESFFFFAPPDMTERAGYATALKFNRSFSIVGLCLKLDKQFDPNCKIALLPSNKTR